MKRNGNDAGTRLRNGVRNTHDLHPMTIVPREHQHFLFDRDLKPVVQVRPGEEAMFHTLDACCGEVRTVEQLLWRRTTDRKSNPMNGPVFVEGAAPGDTLTVEILRVELDRDGFQLIGPNRAVIRQEITAWTCYAFQIENGRLRFPNGIEVPAEPVIGQFGNAPSGAPTNRPGRLGGNMDAPVVKTGARLYLPVEVEGAVFSLGDVHACQGDGEVVGAPEIGAKVVVRFDLLKRRHSEWFMVEDTESWHTCCAADNEHEAARLAAIENAKFISRTCDVEFHDAFILLTLIGKLSIARTGKWGDHGPVVCSSFSKQKLKDALRNHRRSSAEDRSGW